MARKIERDLAHFAIYRLPHQQQCTFIAQRYGEPTLLDAAIELNQQQGFVFAPFHPSVTCPIVLLRPDVVETWDVERDNISSNGESLTEYSTDSIAERIQYQEDFAHFHAQLEQHCFEKLVLSRCSSLSTSTSVAVEELFMRACQMYPRLFIALISSPQCGTWLMATPEILLDGHGNQWSTMALAGTQKMINSDELAEKIQWSEKNQREQQMVSTYITECIERFSSHVTQYGPYTSVAANLYHLRTDFSFVLNESSHLGDVISALHPTPAVCGLPKEAAYDFILKKESNDRKYYSGFCGPLDMGERTHLYVSLRCMEVKNSTYDLYAGGGLLSESNEAHEWAETEAKLETMRRLLY